MGSRSNGSLCSTAFYSLSLLCTQGFAKELQKPPIVRLWALSLRCASPFQHSALYCTPPNKDTRNHSFQIVFPSVPHSSSQQGMGLLAHSMRCVAWDARSFWESLWLTVTWAFVQLPGLSYISLTEPHTLANGWPDAIVVSTGEDGV